jgi:predicted negative regulator of RcsB-dependent stress response
VLGDEIMKDLMIWLKDNSSAIIALATVVIAVFSLLTWKVSHSIHKASIQRDKETTEMYLNLVAAILASGEGFGEPTISADQFDQQKKKLLQYF